MNLVNIGRLCTLTLLSALGIMGCFAQAPDDDDDDSSTENTSDLRTTRIEGREERLGVAQSGQSVSGVQSGFTVWLPTQGCPGCGPLPDPWKKAGPLPDPWLGSENASGNEGSNNSAPKP